MNSVPDQPPRHHESLDDLRRAYPEWVIESGAAGLPVYTAEHRDCGGALRYLVAHDLASLAVKLEAADREISEGRTS
jgi:hypothetical protein